MSAMRPNPLALGLCFGVASTTPTYGCETALLLAVDVSNSVDMTEYRLQADGIAAAFRDPIVIDAMVQGGNRVAILHWSGSAMQRLVLPWTTIRSPADMEILARRAELLPRAFVGGNTAIGEALSAGLAQMSASGACRNRIIDLSGDGADNAGSNVGNARRQAEAMGVTINGLAIEGMGKAISGYYSRQVITRGGFVETARGFTDFARAMRVKMRRELSRILG